MRLQSNNSLREMPFNISDVANCFAREPRAAAACALRRRAIGARKLLFTYAR